MELIRSLGALAEAPAPEHQRIASLIGLGPVPESAAFTDLFVFQLYPYASVYLSAEGMLGGEARDRIAGFWRALGRRPPPEPDHLGALLGLYAGLSEAEASEGDPAERMLARRARCTLLSEHILSWVGPYLQSVSRLGPPFYAEWAHILTEVLHAEAEIIAEESFTVCHFIPNLCVGDPRFQGGERFLEDLLCPVRSGLMIPRVELARASRELSLGFRLGERRYQLRALMSQDPEGLLAWLRGLAGRWCEWHHERSSEPGVIRSFWMERASATRQLLGELLSERWDETNAPSVSASIIPGKEQA
jgi:TorA maturation chaperone TorD